MRFWRSTSNRSSDTAGLRDSARLLKELVDLVLSVAAGGLSKPRLIEIFESRCKPPEGL
jgi:hypothetical protein